MQAARLPDPGPAIEAPQAHPKPGPLLELRAIDKTFGSVAALSGLQASVAPGEFVTVVGPSGCGKSTLFNIVAGLEEPDAGGILRFEGKSCHAADLLGRVSFMPQRDLLFPWRNVVDNAILALEVEGMPREQARAKALKMLPEFGLAGFEKQYPNQLSGGMRQRVALMRTFLFERDLMLLDEPFGALDAQTRVIMQQILTNMWQRLKISVLFVTHDIDEAIFLSDRVYCMTARPGSIKAEIPIPLERPRQQAMMMSSEFLGLRRGLMSLIREESLKAMGGEITDMGMQGLNIELHGHSLADVI